MAVMGPSELTARARRETRHRLDAVAFRLAPAVWRRTWTPSAQTLDEEARPALPRGILRPDRAHSLGEASPGAAAAIVALAERIAEGRRQYFGYPDVQLAEPVDFSHDPVTDDRWADRHSKRLEYRGGTRGDPKWIWELNRLHELPLLVEAWLLSGEERFAQRALDLGERWLRTSAPGRGVAWSNGYEAALRAISLSVTLDALRGSAQLTRERERLFAHGLWQHGRWIARDPSTHSSANNHRIGELAGLVTIGLLVPELGRDGSAWLAHGLRGLAIEAERQIAADGTTVEQAFRYHLHTLEFLLLSVALLDATASDVPAEILAAIDRSGDALWAQLGEAEPEPTYGDSDDAWVVRLDGLARRDARGIAAAIAARLGHARARRAAGTLDAAGWWLFGAEGAARFADTAPATPPGNLVLPDAGLTVLRRSGRRVLFDSGSLGYLSIAAHGHADALQVTVADDGDDLVVDPGVGSYFARPHFREAFRGTSAHATVTVDGLDQSESGGPFLWRRHAEARLLEADLEAGVVAGEHDGYTHLDDPVHHRRVLIAGAGAPVLVYDRVTCRGEHRLAQAWPLHPDLDAEPADASLVRCTRDGTPRLLLQFASSAPGTVSIVRGQETPPRGWFSPGLERIEPACLVTWETTATGPVDLVALLWPMRGGEWPEPQLNIVRAGVSLRCTYVGVTGPVELELDTVMADAPPGRP